MFTPIIGLEVHLQLKTKSKVFCSCSTAESEPNTNVCPICLGYPGAMPNLNKKALEKAIAMGIALKSNIAKETNWDRKSYMYPDLFKGYQISQLDDPICGEGEVTFIVRDRKNFYSKDNYSKTVGIIRAHLEEDTAKSIYQGEELLLDANKAGYPLLEVVSAPDMHTVDEAVSFAKTIRNLARWFDVCDGNLELGQMRFDSTVSLALEDRDITNLKFSEWKGIKQTPIVEIKNLNSFGNLQDALEYEIKRQQIEYENTHREYSHGSKETRGWDDAEKKTVIQRRKEEANEYRFIPEPDIPTVFVTEDDINQIKTKLPSHPEVVKEELNAIKEFSQQAIDLIAEDISKFSVYKKASVGLADSSLVKLGNLITNELAKEISENVNENNDAKWCEGLNKILRSVEVNKINSNQLKTILKDHKVGECDWDSLLNNASSTESYDLKAILIEAFAQNQSVVEQIKSGKDSAKMFFVGIVMRNTKGQANADEIKKLIDELI